MGEECAEKKEIWLNNIRKEDGAPPILECGMRNVECGRGNAEDGRFRKNQMRATQILERTLEALQSRKYDD